MQIKRVKVLVKRKAMITLIEVLISISILSIILVMIFGFFREMTLLDEQAHIQQTAIFQQRYAESRLSYVFSRLTYQTEKQKKFPFFLDFSHSRSHTAGPSLVFKFNNGIRLSSALSGDVLARLYVNPKDQFCLAIWPNHKENPEREMHKEVLLENVTGIKFEFFSAPEIPGTPPGTSSVPQKGAWINDWSADYKVPPVLVKITLNISRKGNALEKRPEKNTGEIVLAFALPLLNKTQSIFFEGK